MTSDVYRRDFSTLSPSNNSIMGKLVDATESPWIEQDGNFEFILYSIVVPLLFGCVTLIGIAGNVLVIWVIISRAKMRSVTNILLLNLALADLSFVLICPPFTAYQFATAQWPFGNVVCKLMHYLLNVTAYVTVYTLVLISMLRYLTILYSSQTKHIRTKSNVAMMNAGLWILMMLCNIPILFTHGEKRSGNQTSCENYSAEIGRELYATFFVFAYLLPLSLIAALSVAILHYINKQKPSMVGKPKRKSDDKKKQASRLIISVVVIFAIFWLPIHIHLLIAYFGELPISKFYQALSITFNVLGYSNACVNPIIYNFASQEFREAFHSVVCCCDGFMDKSKIRKSTSPATTVTRSSYLSKPNNGETNDLVTTVIDDENV